MADDKTRKAIEQAARTLFIRNLAHRQGLVRPKMRPHTWVFLQQDIADPSAIICLGIVFATWDQKKYNSINFEAELHGNEITTTGRFADLTNGMTGLIITERWAWESLLGEFKGLSAGDL